MIASLSGKSQLVLTECSVRLLFADEEVHHRRSSVCQSRQQRRNEENAPHLFAPISHTTAPCLLLLNLTSEIYTVLQSLYCRLSTRLRAAAASSYHVDTRALFYELLVVFTSSISPITRGSAQNLPKQHIRTAVSASLLSITENRFARIQSRFLTRVQATQIATDLSTTIYARR